MSIRDLHLILKKGGWIIINSNNKQICAIKTKTYTFHHSIELPVSTIFDYDYSSDPNIRFPFTYLHNVAIFENITHVPVMSFEFTSDTCAEMVLTLYRLWAFSKDTFDHPIDILIKVPPDNVSDWVISFISSYNGYDHPIILCMIRKDTLSTPDFIFKLDGNEEIENFIDLLETGDIEDMFVPPSTDRD